MLCPQVFQSCGNPRPIPARSRRDPQEESRHHFQIYPPEEKPTTAGGTNLDRLVGGNSGAGFKDKKW